MKPGMLFDDFRKNRQYDIACFSGVGRRDSQQDCAYVAANDDNVIVCVCDGMGGYEGGEIASQTAVEAFIEFYQFYGIKNNSSDWMVKAATQIDRIVYDLTDKKGKRLGAGSTIVGIQISGKYLSWVSVGDSHAYLFRNKEMARLTIDHNYYYELNRRLENGDITKKEYLTEAKMGEALISFIGMGELEMIDNNSVPLELQTGDTLIVCTDGVYRTVSDHEIQEAVESQRRAKGIETVLQGLIDERESVSQDNYSCVIIRIN